MVDEGKYRAAAVKGSVVITETAKGKEHVVADFRITEGEFAGETLSWRGWLSDKAMPYTIAALKAMGWDGRSLAELGDLPGEVSIQVEHDEYGGKTTAKVAFVNAPPRRLAADKAAALDARMKAAEAAPVADPFED